MAIGEAGLSAVAPARRRRAAAHRVRGDAARSAAPDASPSSARATRRSPAGSSPCRSPRGLGEPATSSPPASRAASTPPRTKPRIATGTVAVLAGGLDHHLPARECRPRRAHRRATAARRSARCRWAASRAPTTFRAATASSPACRWRSWSSRRALRSGSLITARRAADQGRLVFAVPGSPLDPRAAGDQPPDQGGRQHRHVDRRHPAAKFEPMLGRDRRRPPDARRGRADARSPPMPTSRRAGAIVEALGPTPVEIDEIIRFTGLRPAVVHLVLLELDLAGRLERHPGGRVSHCRLRIGSPGRPRRADAAAVASASSSTMARR